MNVYEAERLSYKQLANKYILNGNIASQYGLYHIYADIITVVMAEGTEKKYTGIEKINTEESKFTGCNLDKPHYYFEAKEVIIYPDDHLIAKHVILRELNGKLPLFYWPYLYISLKEKDQHLIPQFGYSKSRGWFIKTTYYYNYKSLPGESYLDYYTKSGYAGGFKQHFFMKMT